MRFRCAQCRALTQVQIPARMTAPIVTACSGCGRRYRFAVDRPRAADDQERYRQAKEFAEANQIDLGSAYSILEGVMTLEDARALRKGLPPLRPAAPPAPAGAPERLSVSPRSDLEEALVQASEAAAREAPDSKSESRTAPTLRTPPGQRPVVVRPALAESEVGYDPGFADAVRDGTLTPRQAPERGERPAPALALDPLRPCPPRHLLSRSPGPTRPASWWRLWVPTREVC